MTRDAVKLSEQALQFMEVLVCLCSQVCKAQVVPDADELSEDSEAGVSVEVGSGNCITGLSRLHLDKELIQYRVPVSSVWEHP